MTRKTEIVRLTPDRWKDLEAVFETSEECRACWCMNHRCSPEKVPTGDEARDALRKLTESGGHYGLIAYVDGAPVGWCSVDPLATQIGHDYYLDLKSPPSPSTWMIHCLYVTAPARGAGLSTQLVQRAVEVARENGASEVLGFPIPEETKDQFPSHDAEFSGRMSTYLKQGFVKEERLNDFYQKVRLSF